MRCTAERNNTGGGAVLGLSAIGKQDTYFLSDNPEHSFFHYKNKRHTKFIKKYNYHTVENPKFNYEDAKLQTRFTEVGGTSNVITKEVVNVDINALCWPFDQSVDFLINPKTSGDLCSNMYLKFRVNGEKNPNPFHDLPNQGNQYITPNAGRSMIKSVEMLINGESIEKLDSEWYTMRDELYNNQDETTSAQSLLNAGTPLEMFNRLAIDHVIGTNYYIPLDLFFCRKKEDTVDEIRPYFPLCALYNQQITIRVTFQPTTYFCANPYFPYLPNITLVTEEYMVTPEEREYIKKHHYKIPINVVEPQPQHSIPAGTENTKMELVANYPLKAIHWIIRQKPFIDNNHLVGGPWTSWLRRNSTMSVPTPYNSMQYLQTQYVNENNYPNMYNATLYINGVEYKNYLATNNNTSIYPSYYYKYIQNITHGLPSPYRNIYTISFTQDIETQIPEGVVDFSQITQGNAILSLTALQNKNVQANDLIVNMYFNGFKTLEIKDGFSQILNTRSF